MKIAFIDTETTGLDPNKAEVIEFAAILQEPGKPELAFYTRIKPERLEDADPIALALNGYNDHAGDWDRAPTMGTVGPRIIEFLKGATICGHNVSFDEAMLNANLKRAGVKGRVPGYKIDTVTLAYEHLFPLGLKSVSLGRIRDFLDWDKVDAHTAMKDARDAQRLYDLTIRMNWWGRLKIRIDRFWLGLRD